MITGYSDIPLPHHTISALDKFAESIKMECWYLTDMAAISLEDADKTGVQVTVQFSRKASHKTMGFKHV